MNRLPIVLAAVSLAAFVGACDKAERWHSPFEGAPGATSQTKPSGPAAPEPITVDPARFAAFGAVPARMDDAAHPTSAAKIALGKTLYFDTRLSKNHDLSCNSCHDVARYGVDLEKTSSGHKGQRGTRNSPTVFFAAGHFVQFWDGRAADVEAQALGPVLNPVEMAMESDKAVVEVLASMKEYEAAFKAAFPDDKKPVSFTNMGIAIGAFERTLVTGPSKWDRFVAGDGKALDDVEKRGFNLFYETGCITCHNGPYFGGNSYRKLGDKKPWPDQTDLGRFAVTKIESDKQFFKVPSLRNVAKTGPWFHDGSVATLEDAVTKMASFQLGKELAPADAKAIVRFLETLTGTLPTIAPPVLPKSTDKTPKPSAK